MVHTVTFYKPRIKEKTAETQHLSDLSAPFGFITEAMFACLVRTSMAQEKAYLSRKEIPAQILL